MADISLDLNKNSANYRDLLIVDNDLVLTSDADPNGTNSVQQDILQTLRFWQGEWFLDVTIGMPYLQQILVKNPDQSKIDALFLNAILGTVGVQQLVDYSFSINTATRQLSIAFRVITTGGENVNFSGDFLLTEDGQVITTEDGGSIIL